MAIDHMAGAAFFDRSFPAEPDVGLGDAVVLRPDGRVAVAEPGDQDPMVGRVTKIDRVLGIANVEARVDIANVKVAVCIIEPATEADVERLGMLLAKLDGMR